MSPRLLIGSLNRIIILNNHISTHNSLAKVFSIRFVAARVI